MRDPAICAGSIAKYPAGKQSARDVSHPSGKDLTGHLHLRAVQVYPGYSGCLFILFTRTAFPALRSGHVCASVREAADFVEVAFKDNGQGIPPAALDLIFEPFYSTKQGGTGLGLAISQSIAQNHGGELLASSVMGKGSTFTLKLPLKSPLVLPRMG